MKKYFVLTVIITSLIFFPIPYSFGHGFHHDFTPTQKIGEKEVLLKFTSSPSYDPDTNAREIHFQILDVNTTQVITGTVFYIKTTKSGEFLFEYTSENQDDGLLIMEFLPVESETITIEEKKDVVSKEFPNNPKYDQVSIQSNDFENGGLYFFEVKILEVENRVVDEPLVFFVQIPFPHKTIHEIKDSHFGTQSIELISYFDKTSNFQYVPQTRTFSFEMPYEWTSENINRTSVVHQELTIPKTFGNLMVAEYNAYVNDIQIPSELITLDEFFTDGRLVHIILSHTDLLEFQKRQDSDVTGMKFVLEPVSEDIPFSTVTGNGQFRILVEPKNFEVGSDAKILFNITEASPPYTPVETNYDLTIRSGEEILLTHFGKSTSLIDAPNEIEFTIPKNSTSIDLKFFDVGGSSFGVATLPVKVLNTDLTNADENISLSNDSSQPSFFDELIAFFEKLFAF